MQRSTYHILTTHTGRLPRPDDLLEMLMAREQGRLHDLPAFHARLRQAIGECVRKQRDASLDMDASRSSTAGVFISRNELDCPRLLRRHERLGPGRISLNQGWDGRLSIIEA